MTIFAPIKTNEPALVVCTLRESFSPDLFSLPVLVNLGKCCCVCILQCEVLNLSLSFPINLPYDNRHWDSTEKQGILMSQRTIQWENICAQELPRQFLFIQMKHVFSFTFFLWNFFRTEDGNFYVALMERKQPCLLLSYVYISHTMFWLKGFK